MFKMLHFFTLSIVPILLVSSFQSANGYDWRESADAVWAKNCDWAGNDLSSKAIRGDQCSNECGRTPGCTHFTWTRYQGGTCWMKKNPVSKNQAISLNENFAVCGLMKSVAGPAPVGPSPSNSPDKVVYAKTIYAEARGEPEEGQRWVAWVIKNRARLNRDYWGGSSIKNVCLKPGQFECWNGKTDIEITERDSYNRILQWSSEIFDAPNSQDPTGGADHYNNPDKEGYPPWTNNCIRLRKIANHQFYKGP